MTPPSAKAPAHAENPYLNDPVPKVFFRTALPIILVMTTNGLFTVIDAVFIGLMVGADALTAVTAMFPIFMFNVALSTLVSSGMASRMARQLGAGALDQAAETRSSALLLSLAIALAMNILFQLVGRSVIAIAVDGDPALAAMSGAYITPLIFGIPLALVLSLESEALRSEGKAADLAKITISATVFNIAFNYLLIGPVGLGVLGSSLGTLAAQTAALIWILRLRASGKTAIGARLALPHPFHAPWGRMLVLGLPPALNFMGVSLLAGFVILSIQRYGAAHYSETLAAYGIITRITALTFLPLLGFSMAAQSVVGNNFGAGHLARVDAGLKTALLAVLAYCGFIETMLIVFAEEAATLFVDDAKVIAEVGRILPVIISSFMLSGPVLVLAGYFQALGDAARAAMLGLGRIYVFSLPLLAVVPGYVGEQGIWLTTPIADSAMLLLAITVLAVNARRTRRRFGLFFAGGEP